MTDKNPASNNQPSVHPWRALKDREVTRKEFVGIMGAGALSVMGLDRIIELLGGNNHSGKAVAVDGYGGGAYGGSDDYPHKLRMG